MISSRKGSNLVGRLNKMADELAGLQASCGAMTGAQLTLAVEARDRLQQALIDTSDALAHARAAEVAMPVSGWDASARLPLWREAMSPATRTGLRNGARIGPGVHLFHDCPMSEILLQQVAQDAGAPFGLVMEAFTFQGSFLSLAVDFPEDITRDIADKHIVRVSVDRRFENEGALYLRLNVQSGPNTEQLTGSLSGEAGIGSVEFDLGYSADLVDCHIDKIWLDIMVDKPAANRVELRDIVVAHRRRAEM